MPNLTSPQSLRARLSASPENRIQTRAPGLLVRAYSAASVAECLVLAKKELGAEAMILRKRAYRQGAFLGRWGGRAVVEVTFGVHPAQTTADLFPPSRARKSSHAETPAPILDETEHQSRLQKMEAQIVGLSASIQALVESGKKGFVSSPVEARNVNGALPPSEASASMPKRGLLARQPEAPPSDLYAALLQQLLDSEVAAPLARQLIAQLPAGISGLAAANALRTLLSQRLLIANKTEVQPGAKMRLLAFVGTTGVGKTTTIAKLAAQYALVERRRVGVVTLDTQRIAAAQQLQTFGEIMHVPVKIAHDKTELVQHLSEFAASGMELVLLDTAGRSPNDMIPLGETAHLFDGMGAVQKFLAIPATLSARDMENIVARFQNILAPDALILTKLDEASDNTCFGKLLTVQAKYGLPLAYVTTGQKVPDDIAFPDSHAIAARILSTAIL